MTKPRPLIPKKIKDDILVACRHSCIICQKEWVKIHHGDGDPSNNDEDNLFPLCTYHHALVHMSPPPSSGVQKYTLSQLRRYKKNWIEWCRPSPPIQRADNFKDIKQSPSEIKGEIRKRRSARRK